MTALRRGLLALLLVAAALLAPVAATAATDAPSGGPDQAPAAPADAPDVPEAVTSWFAEQGGEVAAELAEDDDLVDPDDLVVGAPRRVATWNEAYVAGEELDLPAEPTAEWVAPVLSQAAETPEPVGVVHADAGGGAVQLVEVIDDAELAGAVHRVPGTAVLVRDDSVEGWFAVLDGEVWPVTEGARTVLQGALPTEVFQEFLAAWRGESPPTAAPAAEADDGGTVSPLIPIGIIVVIGAVVAWLLLRDYRRADTRIAEHVHAGMTPPPDGADAAGADEAPDRPGG